ncbi:8609_t:CDS:2 [Ambispora gerdemannii]|uniref:8609_t:CDS:1 n=1 Tax=Ambispora gerdemannii TaxID=144530 RepID=A0A9N8UYK1_9GLOM|nr:8609_t:CDS:2 [Ambispora gerdemannii]
MHYEEDSNENANLQQNQSRKNNVPKSAAKPKVPLTYSPVVNKKYEPTATLDKDEWHDVMATINHFDRIGITRTQQYCTDLMNGYREWHKSSEDTIPKQIVEKIFIPFNISHDKEIESQKQHHHSQVQNLKSKYEAELYESREKIQKLEEELDTLTHETKSAKEETSRLQNLKAEYETALQESRGKIQELEEERKITDEKYENEVINLLQSLNETEKKYQDALEFEKRKFTNDFKSEKQKIITDFNSKFESEKQRFINNYKEKLQKLNEQAQNLKFKHETELQESRGRIQVLKEELKITKEKYETEVFKRTNLLRSLNETEKIYQDALEFDKQKSTNDFETKYETELQNSRERIQELEEERKITLSALKNLQYEDNLTHETKSAKKETSRLQSALDVQWNNDDISNPLQLTKDIDKIQALLNNVTKVKPKTLIRINESTSKGLFNGFHIQNIMEERTYKIALSCALQRIIIDEIIDVIADLPSTIDSAAPIHDGNLEAFICYHLDKLVFLMDNLADNRSGDDETTIIAPTKIRQQVFASLGSRGYSKPNHPIIDWLTRELLKKMDNYREVLSEERKKLLNDQVAEVVVELIRLRFRLHAQDPIPDIRWVESGKSICGGFMQGPWDIEDSQNVVVDFCYFPAIGTDLDDDTNRCVYCKAQVLVRPKKSMDKFSYRYACK